MSENKLKDETLMSEFRTEQAKRSFISGIFLAVLGIPAFLYLTFYHHNLLHPDLYIPWTIVGIIPLVLFLSVIPFANKQTPDIIIKLHVFSLTGIMIAFSGIGFDIFNTTKISESYKSASAAIITIIIMMTYLLAAGARRYLTFIVSIPFILMLFYLHKYGTISPDEWSFLFYPLITVLFVSTISLIHQKLCFKEFKARMQLKQMQNINNNKQNSEQNKIKSND